MSATDVPTGRALHLIDLENVLGDPWLCGPGVAAVYEEVLVSGGYRPTDLVVVAVNPGLVPQLGFGPHTPCQLLAARGRDGADRALLGWATPEWIATRFDRLVVASGDGIFTEIVCAARDLGLAVEVLYGRGQASARLRRADVPLVRVPVEVYADLHGLAA